MGKVKDWLKYFFGSYFSHKIASEGSKRSFGNAVLGLLLMFVLLFAGLIAGHQLSFGYLYDGADDYKVFMHSALSEVKFSVRDGKAYGDKIINSYVADDERYKINGYELVVDLRDTAHLYDDFTLECKKENGEIIAYEDYRNLSAEAKKSYSVKPIYSGNVLDINANQAEYEQYLKSVSDSSNSLYDRTIAETFTEIQKEKGSEKYSEKLYLLYARAYYPNLTEYEMYQIAPTIRGYYSTLRSSDADSKYLMIFSDQLVSSFETKGFDCFFTGYYTKLNGFQFSGGDAATCDKLIKTAFQGASSMNAMVYFINVLQSFSYILIIWVGLAVILFGMSHFFKLESGKHVFGAFTIVGSFFLMNGVVSMVASFIFSFFMSKANAYFYGLLVFYIALAVRGVWFIVEDIIRARLNKNNLSEEQNG